MPTRGLPQNPSLATPAEQEQDEIIRNGLRLQFHACLGIMDGRCTVDHYMARCILWAWSEERRRASTRKRLQRLRKDLVASKVHHACSVLIGNLGQALWRRQADAMLAFKAVAATTRRFQPPSVNLHNHSLPLHAPTPLMQHIDSSGDPSMLGTNATSVFSTSVTMSAREPLRKIVTDSHDLVVQRSLDSPRYRDQKRREVLHVNLSSASTAARASSSRSGTRSPAQSSDSARSVEALGPDESCGRAAQEASAFKALLLEEEQLAELMLARKKALEDSAVDMRRCLDAHFAEGERMQLCNDKELAQLRSELRELQASAVAAQFLHDVEEGQACATELAEERAELEVVRRNWYDDKNQLTSEIRASYEELAATLESSEVMTSRLCEGALQLASSRTCMEEVRVYSQERAALLAESRMCTQLSTELEQWLAEVRSVEEKVAMETVEPSTPRSVMSSQLATPRLRELDEYAEVVEALRAQLQQERQLKEDVRAELATTRAAYRTLLQLESKDMPRQRSATKPLSSPVDVLVNVDIAPERHKSQ